DGQLLLAIKARSEDVTADPEAIYDKVCEELRESYDILDRERLDPYHDGHLGVVARKR
ncbi:MAG: fibrillarin-like rRNA/tRNA 2'-O-methyltransferase, partial [Halonotius sp.]